MRLTRVGVLSAGKLAGLLYALLGLIVGAIFALVSTLGGAFGAATEGDAGGPGMMLGFGFGVAMLLLAPILYGVAGFLGGMLTAALYNLVAGLTGGLEVDITQ